jgi:hypothetical protein
MNITFRQLKLFLALAETGSVSAAAKFMHVTQPTASMQLKDITESVGLPLYEVVSKKSISQMWKSLLQLHAPSHKAGMHSSRMLMQSKGFPEEVKGGGSEYSKVLHAALSGKFL